VDTTPALESIAKTLPGLPVEALESMLVTLDTLVGLADTAQRPVAARFLRDAASLCQNPANVERLLRAADDVAAGRPCALTPEGLTGQQAAAAQTMSLEEWQARPDLQDVPLPATPSPQSLDDLWDLIEDRLCAAEDQDEDNELLEPIREDVEEAKAWLTTEGDRGPAPEYTSADEVEEVFGVGSEMASWMRRLFEGMAE
jgi:hypothetical protein